MTALGRKADIQPGRMSALTNSGRSEVLEPAKVNGSFRPEAVISNHQYVVACQSANSNLVLLNKFLRELNRK
jgi:hypothetical protein